LSSNCIWDEEEGLVYHAREIEVSRENGSEEGGYLWERVRIDIHPLLVLIIIVLTTSVLPSYVDTQELK
jgi:hypothetical protein